MSDNLKWTSTCTNLTYSAALPPPPPPPPPLVNHPARYLSYCPHRLCSPSLSTRDAISHLLISLPRLSCVRPPGEDPISSTVRTHCSTSEEEEMERLASAAAQYTPQMKRSKMRRRFSFAARRTSTFCRRLSWLILTCESLTHFSEKPFASFSDESNTRTKFPKRRAGNRWRDEDRFLNLTVRFSAPQEQRTCSSHENLCQR